MAASRSRGYDQDMNVIGRWVIIAKLRRVGGGGSGAANNDDDKDSRVTQSLGL